MAHITKDFCYSQPLKPALIHGLSYLPSFLAQLLSQVYSYIQECKCGLLFIL